MPLPWIKRVKTTGQLTVFNKAAAWKPAVTAAMGTFNSLGLGVKLVDADDEHSANVVVLLSNGSDSYPYYGKKIKANFNATKLHGFTHTESDGRKGLEIFLAVIFLPGQVSNPTAGQKEVVIVHEFMHAAGLNGLSPDGTKDPNDDHEDQGIMFATMQISGKGAIEYLHDKDAKPMPPIRVGPKSMCKLHLVWLGEGCKND